MKNIEVPAKNDDATFERLVRQEELILSVTNVLTEALIEAGVTKSELAQRIGRSPGFVSHVFGGGRNLTLRTISDVAAALELRPELRVAPDRRSNSKVLSEWQQDFQFRLRAVRKKIELPTDSESVVDTVMQVA